MSAQISTKETRILLSFSSAYANLARKISEDLGAANIEVRYNKWEGGGGVTAIQPIDDDIDDVTFIVPLLTPSDTARTWIGDEWRQSIYNKALARGINVLPVRGDGDKHAIPHFLIDRTFVDLKNRNYNYQLKRLIETIRDKSGNTRIKIPKLQHNVDRIRSPMNLSSNPLVLEVGKELASLLERDDEMTPFYHEDLMMRDGLFYELGVKFPKLSFQVIADIPPWSARIVINEIPEIELELHPDMVMVNESNSVMRKHGFASEPAINPNIPSRVPGTWIPASEGELAKKYGFTTWDTTSYLILAISSVLRRKAADFIVIEEVQRMLEQIKPTFPHLIAETIPKTISLFLLTDVLRRLVTEGISIRNLRRILMTLADWGRYEDDPVFLTEYVRAALKRQITHRLSRGNDMVVFLLDPEIETTIHNAFSHTATGSYLNLKPSHSKKILDAISEPLSKLDVTFQVPPILTKMEIRSSVRRLVAFSMPYLDVTSHNEITPTTNIQSVGRISLQGFTPRSTLKRQGIF